MKKSYSQLNLLQKKLSKTAEAKSWVNIFFSSKYRYLNLEIPYYSYLRGEVFCQDLKDVFEEEVPLLFSINRIIDLLYIDFINRIKKGTNLKQLSTYLVESKYKYLSTPVEQKRVMKKVNTNLFTFEMTEEEVLVKEEEEKTAYITMRMKEAEILRGEIFLHDLSPFTGDQPLQIEEVFVILYLDFIEKIKENENTLAVMKAIVARL